MNECCINSKQTVTTIFMINFFLTCIRMQFNMNAKQLQAETTKFPKIVSHSIHADYRYIIMQMIKVNHEKGHYHYTEDCVVFLGKTL